MYRVLAVLLLISSCCFSQLSKECFNKNGLRTDEQNSEYCVVGKKILRVDKFLGKNIDTVESYVDTVTAYYSGINKVKFIRIYNSEGYLDGNFIEYYPNGKFKERGTYVDGNKEGYVVSFYPNGKSKSTVQFLPQGDPLNKYYETAFKIIHYRDSTGREIVKSGNGFCNCRFVSGRDEIGKVVDGLRDSIWNEYLNDTLILKENYSKGKLIEGVRYYEGNEYIYNGFEVPPEYKGGLKAMYGAISKHMKYPVSARKMQIEGTVFTQFTINKDGTVSNAEITKGISRDIDLETLRIVNFLQEWVPGKLRGLPVSVKFQLPIKFSLD